MAVNYPASLDNFTNPTSSSSVANPSHSQQHSDANDAIEALQAKVGANGSAVTTSHDYKIAQLESLVTSSVAGAKSIYQDVRNQSGSSLAKATPVYVSGSEGASGKILISAASNAAESTSSKTMGITTSAIANNSNGQVISEGILEGIDTTGAADGDPVWLGTNGAKIYGLANKPSAPSHLVFLGIVIRGGQANTGSMYVKIQNGFEIEELHNVQISSPVNGNILAYDSTSQTWKNTNTLQSTSTTVPLTIRGTGWTMNLQEWKSSDGTLKAYVNPYGSIISYASANYFISDNPSNPVLVVKGFTSQTANLQEWQNSSGTVLASVDPNGQIRTPQLLNVASFNNSRIILSNTGTLIDSGVATNVILKVQSTNASQTADLQQWQDSAGTVFVKIDSNGHLYTSNKGIYLNTSYVGNTRFFINSSATTMIGAIIKAAASQTADLQQWQNSAGSVISKVDSTGFFSMGASASPGGVLGITASLATYRPLVIKAAASQTANLTEWQDSSGTVLAKIDASGIGTFAQGVFAGGAAIIDGGGGATLSALYTGALKNSATAYNFFSNVSGSPYATVVVKGLSGQTTDLQQWQNSNGTVMSKITSAGEQFWYNPSNSSTLAYISMYGEIFAQGNMYVRSAGNYGASVNITTPTTTYIGQVIRGAASQTANLQEWQNSAGTILSKIDSNGALSVTNAANVVNATTVYNAAGTPVFNVDTTITAVNLGGGLSGGANNYGSTWGYDSSVNAGYITFQTGALGSDSLAIRRTNHVASGDYTISSLGNMRFSTASGKNFNFNNGSIGIATTAIGTNNKLIVNPYSTVDNLATVQINTNATTNKGLVVQGVSGQSANLQEWQDSAGVTKAYIDSSNRFFAQSLSSTATGYQGNIASIDGTKGSLNFNTSGYGLIVTSAQSSAVVLTAKGAASQTGNLQEWQDSSGAVLAFINPNGQASLKSTTLTASSSSGSALTLVAASGQTAPLLTTAGGAQITAGGNYFKAPGIEATYVMNVTSGGSAIVPFTVKGASSQTADLQQWQDTSSSTLAKVDSGGTFAARAFAPTGYVTSNSAGGTYTNYWCKIADYTLPGQYTDAVSYMDFSLNGPGFTYVVRGTVYVRVKQQNAMGSAPETPTLVVYNGDGNGFNATDFALVVVQNDSSLTKYELYYKLPYDWASLVSTPTFKVGLINYYSQILPVASLPSGTKTYGRNADAKFNSVTITPEANNAINLIVKPVAGQTYNLQEWQNSSGNIISYVTSSGAIASNTSVTATSFVKNGGTSSQFLKADGSVDSSTYVSTSSSYIAGHHPEGRILASAALVNDLGNARLRGSTFTFTNISPSDADIDKMFDGTANFLILSTSGQTFPIVIEFTLPRTLSWGATVGVGFGLSTWRANSVKIEAFSNGAWVTCIDTTTNTSEDVIAGIPGPNSSGTTKLRYTFANPASTQFRICHLWAYNYNSDMWTQLQMPRSGGTMYGALSTKGDISVLDSSNTTTISLSQNGSGAFAKTDPFGGFSWSNYGNLGVRTVGTSGGYSGIVTIGSATQASSTPALVLRGHTESGSLTNSSPLQVWQKADGTLLAKVDQFGAFTVNVNNASSIPLILKGASSQTANLQEWQNSSGTTQAFVRYDGFINTNNSLRVAGDNISAYRFQGVSDGNYTMNFPGSGNIQLFSAVNDTGSGVGVLGIKNATTAPTSNPTTGGILYVSSGALIYRGAGGAITTIARSGNESSTISANTATTVDTVALSSFTTIEYTISIKQGSKIRSSKVLVHTDGTSVDSTEYGIMEMGGGITGILVSASVSSTNSILQITITDAATTNATVKLIKTML